VRARDVISKIEKAKCGEGKACAELRVRGSHHFFECSCKDQTCRTSVPDHRSKDLGTGLLHSIEKDLEPCLGERWLLG
jgi:predicted RNA binding protein YcfA (HicA-like mRNA interferase family)